MKRALFLLACIFILRPAYGWWDTGHMLVAQIGYTYLAQSEPNKTMTALDNAFNALLTYYNDSSSAVTSACWMDDLKRRGIYQFSNWHFINLPVCYDNITVCETMDIGAMLAEPDNLVWAIKEAIGTIRNKAAGGFERGFAMRNLIHLVGDMHQPLHCVDRYSTETPNGDAGGNLFDIQRYNGASTLHALWDSGAGLFQNDLKRPLSMTDQTYIADWGKRIMEQINPADIPNGNNITAWALENVPLATNYVYNLTFKSLPSPDYIAAAQKVIARQIGIAGYRLAQLLKQIVWCNPNTNNCPVANTEIIVVPGPAPPPEIIKDHVKYTIVASVLSVALAISIIVNFVLMYKRRAVVLSEESRPLTV